MGPFSDTCPQEPRVPPVAGTLRFPALKLCALRFHQRLFLDQEPPRQSIQVLPRSLFLASGHGQFNSRDLPPPDPVS